MLPYQPNRIREEVNNAMKCLKDTCESVHIPTYIIHILTKQLFSPHRVNVNSKSESIRMGRLH